MGAILLSGLFFYDIFWVFGTEVVVTVAKSFDGPIKILFPRVLAIAASASTAAVPGQFSLLGLGDIVIPGLFVALLLRFDAVQHSLRQLNNSSSNKNPISSSTTTTTPTSSTAIDQYHSFPKPHFHTNIFCYCCGLVVTVGVMYFFKAAQPALLYLVPMCLGGSLVCGWVRGEVGVLCGYSEEEEDSKNKKSGVTDGVNGGDEGNLKKDN